MNVTTGIAAVNGTNLYYEVAGNGPPVVLIHGHGLDTRMWDEQFEAFADRYRVIRYDVRGFGRSAIPSAAAFSDADDLRSLLEHVGVQTAHVIGLSMGGRIALHYALGYPAALRSLLLVDSALDGHKWSAPFVDSFAAIEERARSAGVAAGNDMWLAHDLFGPARERPDCRAKLAEIVGDSCGWEWLNQSPVLGIDPPAIARLNEVRAPTLVIVGERDLPDFQSIADTLAEGIPTARKLVMKGVGHMSNMEDAQQFNSLALEFLDAVETGGPGDTERKVVA